MRKSLRTLGLAALVVGASLFGAKKADAVTNGFSVFEYAYTNATSGTTLQIPVMQGTFGTAAVGNGSYRFSVGSGNSLTNYLTPMGVIFYQDSGNNITNGFFNGRDLNSGFSGISDGGSYWQINLALADAGYTSGTGRVFDIVFSANNNDSTNVPVQLNWLYTSVSRSGGTYTTSGRTWSNADVGYNPNPNSLVIVNPIPEPKTLGLVGVAGAALGALRRRHNKSGKRGK
ncbi:PEP-CTERM sorting domain-containing protein [Candidatus Pacearchaeota archaeon]|nr:PEP-CTERM sorting domain-containing protein [Candidatus Pacearchaeota archaeon]